MSKSLSRKKRKPSTSSSDSDEVEWTERKSDSNKDLFDLIESNCSQNIKTIKMRKSEEKRDQELKDNRIRYERELNPLYRNDVNKTFVENPDFGSKEMSKEKSVSINSNLNKSKSKSISLTERNALNAKILKAEMFGNQQLVNELKNKLKQLEDNESNTNDNNEESNVREEYYSVEKKRNEESMSVKEMFFREKRTTVEDENRRFIASSSKTVRNPEDEYEDMRQKQKNRKFDIRNETKIRFHRSEDEEHNKCKQCITSIAKHLILANDENTVITLTPYKPFTYGYCCILSKSHSNVSTVSADEECLAQINQRKCEISKFFDKQNLSVIFMETYFKRKSFSSRHLVIECVPIKSKLESEAKIFFKVSCFSITYNIYSNN